MSSRFPSKEELQDLHAQGIVATSPYFCRIISSLVALVYLGFSGIHLQFKAIFSAKMADPAIFFEQLQPLLFTLIAFLFVYLTVYFILALFQTRFAFRPSNIFNLKKLSKSRKSFWGSRMTTMLNLLVSTFLVFVTAYGAYQFLALRLTKLQAGSFWEFKQSLLNETRELAGISAFFLLISAVVCLLYVKVAFLFKHRVRKA
jgi:flagellar biosynthesis protein FlhB